MRDNTMEAIIDSEGKDEKAQKIITETILATQNDSVTFFNALANPQMPNEDLKSAAKSMKNS